MSTYQIINDDVRAGLRQMDAESVQCVVTSPPYWGLRAYQTDPQIWGGDANCEHVWSAEMPRVGNEYREGLSTSAFKGREDKAEIREAFAKPRRPRKAADVKDPDSKQATSKGTQYDANGGQFCQRCGAWKGELGSEPTYHQYVANIVEVFREVRRVLRADGVCWVNLGSSYAGGNRGPGGDKQATNKGACSLGPLPVSDGLKPKDLVGIPFRVALALQADGWYWRSMIPWIKRNAMPESATDRPGSAVEYWLMLTKKGRYFYDAGAVRVANECSGRNRRNSDWYFDSLRAILDGDSIAQVDEDGEIVALPINPQGSKADHYATYPPRLIDPIVRCSTSEKGCCPECGSPWERVVDKKASTMNVRVRDAKKGRMEGKWSGYGDGNTKATADEVNNYGAEVEGHTKTTGWRPTCECDAGEPVPCTVLDLFNGVGTTMEVALKLGRSAIGIEISPQYCQWAEERIRGVMPLFAKPADDFGNDSNTSENKNE